jgi:ribosomal protein S18 acetylase RimI-like enzyme
MEMQEATIFTTAPAASLKSLFKYLRNSPAAETFSKDGLFYWHTPLPHPWFNGMLVSRGPSRDENEIIAQTRDFFADRKVNAYTVWLKDDDLIEAWAAHLQPAGYVVNLNPPGMSVYLAELPDSVPTPPGFIIRQVDDPDMMQVWTKIFIHGFGLPDGFVEPYYTLMVSLGFNDPLQYYLGYLNGDPATASCLFISDGIVGIYSVATLPQYRGMGLGAAITLAPLLAAREMGIKIGALQSSEMGFRVYQRLGFRKVCDVAHFDRTAY